jgi:hypothetical protein
MPIYGGPNCTFYNTILLKLSIILLKTRHLNLLLFSHHIKVGNRLIYLHFHTL